MRICVISNVLNKKHNMVVNTYLKFCKKNKSNLAFYGYVKSRFAL